MSDPEADVALHDPSEFELRDFEDGDEDSDDGREDEGSLAIGSSGGNGISGKVSPHRGKKPSPIDRAGLVVRTESRERLDLGGDGNGNWLRRGGESRSGSPGGRRGLLGSRDGGGGGGLGGMGRDAGD
jgi:hypothetical protein